MKHEDKLIIASLLVGLPLCGAARADEADSQYVSASAESQQFSAGLGSLRTATLEYKLKSGPTTFVLAPTIGRRSNTALHETAAGGAVTLYHDWNRTISTRSEAFFAEPKSPFAHVDLAQDVTAKVANAWAVTVGTRWARYSGGQEVWFASGGVRKYFTGGSISYRLTYIKPNTRSGYFAHLASFTLNDRKGDGKTQLWLSAGSASLSTRQLPDTFRGSDYSAFIRRVQPLGERTALLLSTGVTSYDRPASRVTGTSLGLGLMIKLR